MGNGYLEHNVERLQAMGKCRIAAAQQMFRAFIQLELENDCNESCGHKRRFAIDSFRLCRQRISYLSDNLFRVSSVFPPPIGSGVR